MEIKNLYPLTILNEHPGGQIFLYLPIQPVRETEYKNCWEPESFHITKVKPGLHLVVIVLNMSRRTVDAI